jgi:FixJ family two-component response regulator
VSNPTCEKAGRFDASIAIGRIQTMISTPIEVSREKANNQPQSSMHAQVDDKVVIVIDNDDEMRTALTTALGSPGRVVRSFASAEEFLASNIVHDRPMCVVSEVRLRALSGLGLQKQLQDSGSRVPIIFLTDSADVAVAVQAIRAGGFDYLKKPVHRQFLLERIEQALDDDARYLLESARKREFANNLASLSRRQRDVFLLLVQGKSNKQIAAELQIGLPTVTRHRARVFGRFGVSSLFQLIATAAALGVLERSQQL